MLCKGDMIQGVIDGSPLAPRSQLRVVFLARALRNIFVGQVGYVQK